MDIQGREGPVTAFLSYVREDEEEVRYLQHLLNIRGVRAWRDVTDLQLGSYIQDEIVHAIEKESDAFLLYLTPQCLRSDFVWDVEVKAALNRWEHDRMFGIVPILQEGIALDELQKCCADRGYQPLNNFHGVAVPKYGSDKAEATINIALSKVAKLTLQAAFDLHLRKVRAGNNYEPRIYLRTSDYAPTVDKLDLDLNWTEFFPKELVPPETVWQEVLLPALDDVKDVLSAAIHSEIL